MGQDLLFRPCSTEILSQHSRSRKTVTASLAQGNRIAANARMPAWCGPHHVKPFASDSFAVAVLDESERLRHRCKLQPCLLGRSLTLGRPQFVNLDLMRGASNGRVQPMRPAVRTM